MAYFQKRSRQTNSSLSVRLGFSGARKFNTKRSGVGQRLKLTGKWRGMSDMNSVAATLRVISNAMDEIAREIGPLNRDDPKRRPLLDELSALTQLRNWLKSETNRTLTLPLDELARELAPLKVRDRRRIQIIGEVISRSHLLDEH